MSTYLVTLRKVFDLDVEIEANSVEEARERAEAEANRAAAEAGTPPRWMTQTLWRAVTAYRIPDEDEA